MIWSNAMRLPVYRTIQHECIHQPPACRLRRNNKTNQDLEVNSLQGGGPLVLFKAQVVSKGIDTTKKFHH